MIKKLIKNFLIELVLFILNPDKEKLPEETEILNKAQTAGKKYLKSIILEILKEINDEDNSQK